MSLVHERKLRALNYDSSIAQPAEELRLVDIWRFLLRRRWWIAVFSVVGVFSGVVVDLRQPKMYTATVTVELNKDATSGLGIQDLSGLASTVGIGQEFMTDMLTHQAVLLNDNT